MLSLPPSPSFRREVSNTPSMYDALSHPINYTEGHEYDRNLYRSGGAPKHGKFKFKDRFHGYVLREGTDNTYDRTNEFEIAYTQWGDKGPLVLFQHGVPTNRYQYFPIQKRMSPFVRTISIDFLGMGESSFPRNYGKTGEVMLKNAKTESEKREAEKVMQEEARLRGINEPWDWIFDVDRIELLMRSLYPNDEKFVFVSDDWGSGPMAHYSAKFNRRLQGIVYINPVGWSHYPVAEIQAIGRASQIPIIDKLGIPDAEFKAAMGDIDQRMVVIFKQMVYQKEKYNQFNLRDIKHPYIDVDYERSKYKDGEDATSLTLRIHWEAVRVLCDRAAILSPALLLPYDSVKNPKGVKFENTTVPVLILFGEYDPMMCEINRHRYRYGYKNAKVEDVRVPRAGHFSNTDQPNFNSEEILKFIGRHLGLDKLADVFFGFDGIFKGDERSMFTDMRKIYGIDVVSKSGPY